MLTLAPKKHKRGDDRLQDLRREIAMARTAGDHPSLVRFHGSFVTPLLAAVWIVMGRGQQHEERHVFANAALGVKKQSVDQPPELRRPKASWLIRWTTQGDALGVYAPMHTLSIRDLQVALEFGLPRSSWLAALFLACRAFRNSHGSMFALLPPCLAYSMGGGRQSVAPSCATPSASASTAARRA